MARGKTRRTSSRGPERRPARDDSGEDSRWLTTYGDAVTLLLAFFVMLYSMSSVDVEKFAQMAASMKLALTGAGSPTILDASAGILDDPTLAPPTPTPPDAPTVAPEVDVLPAEEIVSELQRDLTAANLAEVVEVSVDGHDVVVRVGSDDILFETGSARVGELGRRIIAAIAPTIRDAPNEVRVEGHTDDVPLHRGNYTNWNLSTDRAVAVLTLLADKHGLAAARLSAAGFGEHRPLAPNDDADGRATNRRVEIVLLGTEEHRP